MIASEAAVLWRGGRVGVGVCGGGYDWIGWSNLLACTAFDGSVNLFWSDRLPDVDIFSRRLALYPIKRHLTTRNDINRAFGKVARRSVTTDSRRDD